MELNDWLLALHLLSAFALVAAIVLFSVVIVAVRRTDSPEQVASAGRLLPVGNIAVVVGSLGVIVFGVWLAISLDGVKVWDAWVIVAIVLWAIATEAGRRSDPEFAPGDRARERARRGRTSRAGRGARVARPDERRG